MERNLAMARRIARMAEKTGGRVYFVGGFVRDGVMGRESEDVDIEIHGMTADAVRKMLGEIGPWKEMGASFGVFALRGYTLDIALPRRGGGKGEEADIDPFMGVEEAARRRDFTMNAMMRDALTGALIDRFGGQADIQNRVIRHVDEETFRRDPLRAIRAAQFAARLEFAIAPETMALCRTLDLGGLARERVMGEMEKALTRSGRPSRCFEALREMGQLEPWLKEVAALIGVKQRADCHPEGDAWTHTMLVVDEAAKLRDEAKNPAGLMLAALLHDCTKKLSMEEQLALCEQYGIALDALEKKALKLLHAKTGAALARDVFGVDDEIYNAILWHTTGKPDMTVLEKVIYLADFIEPTRDFPGVDALRRTVWEDLDRGLLMGLEMTVEEMEEMGNPIHVNTLAARDYLKGKTNEGKAGSGQQL